VFIRGLLSRSYSISRGFISSWIFLIFATPSEDDEPELEGLEAALLELRTISP
jgi:hypothetical protein